MGDFLGHLRWFNIQKMPYFRAFSAVELSNYMKGKVRICTKHLQPLESDAVYRNMGMHFILHAHPQAWYVVKIHFFYNFSLFFCGRCLIEQMPVEWRLKSEF